ASFPAASLPLAVGPFFVKKKGNLKMKQSKQRNQTIDEHLQQLREQFQQQTTSPRPETMKRLLAVTPDTLNSIVESQVGTLAEHYTDNEALALGVQLFTRITRQFPALPPFVVIDVVCALGTLYTLRDDLVEALEHLEMI
ncbi:hypothetical protein OFM41_24720, partial [Escherichia coli]|nr:hypothetical protein [Escherichia coli]